MSGPPPSRAQLLTVLVGAAAVSLALMELRGYPWSLATLAGVAVGALLFTGWNTVRRLAFLYRSGSEGDSERQGKSSSEATRRR